MQLKRALMVLAASMEFEKGHNSQVQERVSDNVEVPTVRINEITILRIEFFGLRIM